jgi:hypothetical protein
MAQTPEDLAQDEACAREAWEAEGSRWDSLDGRYRNAMLRAARLAAEVERLKEALAEIRDRAQDGRRTASLPHIACLATNALESKP